MKILIADDNATMRVLPAMLLRKWGYQVLEAADGAEAWEILQREPVSFVISDWMMPGMTGVDLCRKIRAAGSANYTYFILCTSKGDKEDLIEGMDAGADDFLVKPVNKEELRVRVRAGQRVLDLERRLERRNVELKAGADKLRDAYDRIESDLQAAAGMQVNLLPKPDETVTGVASEWRFKPSSYVAGDILNVFPIDDRRVGFYLLDVSGHGVPAAMLSVTLSMVLSPDSAHASPLRRWNEETRTHDPIPPAEAASVLNQRFQSQDDRYFTMIYGVLDKVTGMLNFTQAGAPNPVLIERGGAPRLLGDGGGPIGLWPNMTYDSVEVQLQPGDRLVLYSDGVVECAGREGAQFGEDRVVDYLSRSGTEPLAAILSGLESEMEQWRGNREFDDDVSLLAIEYTQQEAA